MSRSAEEMVAALRAAGCRITRPRLAIVEFVAGRPDHPSARQIHGRLSEREPHISIATVYNTLSTLVELGLVKEVEFESADNRYDTNLAPHINLVCTLCGAIADLDHEPPLSAREIHERIGFEIKEMRMEYRGVCAACRARSDRGGNEDRRMAR